MLAAFLISLISFAAGAYFAWAWLRFDDRLRTRDEVEAYRRHHNHELGD